MPVVELKYCKKTFAESKFRVTDRHVCAGKTGTDVCGVRKVYSFLSFEIKEIKIKIPNNNNLKCGFDETNWFFYIIG